MWTLHMDHLKYIKPVKALTTAGCLSSNVQKKEMMMQGNLIIPWHISVLLLILTLLAANCNTWPYPTSSFCGSPPTSVYSTWSSNEATRQCYVTEEMWRIWRMRQNEYELSSQRKEGEWARVRIQHIFRVQYFWKKFKMFNLKVLELISPSLLQDWNLS